MNVSFRRFVVFDCIGIFIFTVLYTALGFFFHRGIRMLAGKLEFYEHALLLLAVLIVMFLIVRFITQKRKHDERLAPRTHH